MVVPIVSMDTEYVDSYIKNQELNLYNIDYTSYSLYHINEVSNLNIIALTLLAIWYEEGIFMKL